MVHIMYCKIGRHAWAYDHGAEDLIEYRECYSCTGHGQTVYKRRGKDINKRLDEIDKISKPRRIAYGTDFLRGI